MKLVTKSPVAATTLTGDLVNSVKLEEGLSDLGEFFQGVKLPPYSAFFRGVRGSLVALLQSTDPLEYEVTSFAHRATDCLEDLVSVVRPLLRQRSLGVELQHIGEVHEPPRKKSLREELKIVLFDEHLLIFIAVPGVVALASSAAGIYAPNSAGTVTFYGGALYLVAGLIYVLTLSTVRARKVGRNEL